MARRPIQAERHERHPRHSSDAPSPEWEGRLDIIIAIALGLAAVVIAGAVYLNEHQEHKANIDFHQATHRLIDATAAGIRTPAGRALEASSGRQIVEAENHQDKAASYTLAEVILATSLFLFGVAGISSRWRIKVGALAVASAIFLVALVVLATV
jgi:Flp pilus assembly protein TadB